jgi:hypothetical protein
MSTSSPDAVNEEEAVLRDLIAKWVQAVRNEDLGGIRAHHDPDILMFDVPPPFLSLHGKLADVLPLASPAHRVRYRRSRNHGEQ